MVPPPVISWFVIPLTIDISTISPSEIGVICTNLANELGHHLADAGASIVTGNPKKAGWFTMEYPEME